MQARPFIRSLFSLMLLLGFLLSLAGRSLHAYMSHSDLSALCEAEAQGFPSHLHQTADHHQDCDLFHIKITEYSGTVVLSLPGMTRAEVASCSLLPSEPLPSVFYSTRRLRAPPMA